MANNPTPAIEGHADTRGTSLAELATDTRATTDRLRHVLPEDETGRVPVAAFGSSI